MCVCVCVLGWYNVQQTQLERDGLWGELCPLPFPLNVYIHKNKQKRHFANLCVPSGFSYPPPSLQLVIPLTISHHLFLWLGSVLNTLAHFLFATRACCYWDCSGFHDEVESIKLTRIDGHPPPLSPGKKKPTGLYN